MAKATKESNWIRVGRQGRRAVGAPRVTLTRQRQVSLTGTAYEDLGSPSHVYFMFDPKARQLAIVPTTEEDSEAHKVNWNGSRATIHARRMYSDYGLTPEAATSYEPQMATGEEIGLSGVPIVLVADLDLLLT